MKPTFWRNFKIVLIVLFILLAGASIATLLVMEEGWKRLFFASCGGVLAVNVLLAYIFVRVNDRRRPR
ncbi:hypothetical protein [Porphyromonas sp.]|uniref:hypothetical protein n=1 Tax=Porphyromonas sp. TaxID=1924944 RepID=UPI0026DD4CA6|nr:hypothetical protein [Porphyromonas sp.]MDO4695819.1 hypothetical protein [Porphyromonas sp.]MDO4771824.1 hypothetical protein [Porphyromonas sp.]